MLRSKSLRDVCSVTVAIIWGRCATVGVQPPVIASPASSQSFMGVPNTSV